MNVIIYTITSVFLVSLVSLAGLVFFKRDSAPEKPFNTKRFTGTLPLLVSFAVGCLFGDAFIHILPEVFKMNETPLLASVYIIAGIMFFFSLEKFVRWRHCHVFDDQDACTVSSVSMMILVGDGIHNFIDGMLIGASYSISIPIGLTTTLAVFFHEIPQEIGDVGVLLHSGYPIKKALFFNFLSALVAVLGAVVSLVAGPHVKGYSLVLLPFTAGGFIYIAGSDLVPELNKELRLSSSMLQFAAIVAGVAVMALLTLLD